MEEEIHEEREEGREKTTLLFYEEREECPLPLFWIGKRTVNMYAKASPLSQSLA